MYPLFILSFVFCEQIKENGSKPPIVHNVFKEMTMSPHEAKYIKILNAQSESFFLFFFRKYQ